MVGEFEIADPGPDAVRAGLWVPIVVAALDRSVVMRFAGPPDRMHEDVARRIDQALDEELSPDEMRPYWAMLSLRLVDWSIRHFPDALTERWLDFVETRID